MDSPVMYHTVCISHRIFLSLIVYSLFQREHESWMAAAMQFIYQLSSYIPFFKSYIYVYNRIFPFAAGARVMDSSVIWYIVCVSHCIFRPLILQFVTHFIYRSLKRTYTYIIVYSLAQREHEAWMAAVMQFINHRSSYIPFFKLYIYVYDRIFPPYIYTYIDVYVYNLIFPRAAGARVMDGRGDAVHQPSLIVYTVR
jgi:hypothetical protein